MLATLLPGVRDLRTPLATGYLYLLGLWLAVGPERLASADNEFFGRSRSIVDTLGTGAALAAVSFAAFLVGSALIQSSAAPFTRLAHVILRRRLDGPQGDERLDTWVENQTSRMVDRYTSVKELLESPNTSAMFRRWYADIAEHSADKDVPRRALGAALKQVVLYELRETLVIRLRIERESLWDGYDRLVSEAELRFSIFWPLQLLVGVGTVFWSPWCALAAAIPFGLLTQGVNQRRLADDTVVQALVTGVIESPTVKDMLG